MNIMCLACYKGFVVTSYVHTLSMAMTVSLSVDVRKYCDHVNGCIESVKGQNLKKK